MPKIQLDKLMAIKLDKTKKQTFTLIIIGFVLFVVLYFQIFLKTTIAQIFSIIPEVRKLRTDIKRTKEDLNYEGILKKRLKDVEGKINIYEKKLPAEREIPMLLEDLSSMAKDSYVKILGISPMSIDKRRENREKSKIYQEIPIMINAKSGYHELSAFINKLENAGRFMEVSDIKIKSNRANFRMHDVELIVSTYVLLKE